MENFFKRHTILGFHEGLRLAYPQFSLSYIYRMAISF
jgi:hypothetical protein